MKPSVSPTVVKFFTIINTEFAPFQLDARFDHRNEDLHLVCTEKPPWTIWDLHTRLELPLQDQRGWMRSAETRTVEMRAAAGKLMLIACEWWTVQLHWALTAGPEPQRHEASIINTETCHDRKQPASPAPVKNTSRTTSDLSAQTESGLVCIHPASSFYELLQVKIGFSC